MKKYFTRRCIGLHALMLVVVPGCLVAGWWQYQVARGGNGLSWVYTVEWPFFSVYALYVWWKLIHDRSTPFDRLWAAKQRAAADASGTPIHEIPGWALDKELSRSVYEASLGSGQTRALGRARPGLVESNDQRSAGALQQRLAPGGSTTDDRTGADGRDGAAVIDARVVDVKVVEDEELEELAAYNRYLFELNFQNPPKRWMSSRRRSGSGGSGGTKDPQAPVPDSGERRTPELPHGADGERTS
jgi:hypothetical protein